MSYLVFLAGTCVGMILGIFVFALMTVGRPGGCVVRRVFEEAANHQTEP